MTELDFVDWPATIAIDNLEIKTSSVPEPPSAALLVTARIGVGFFLRRLTGIDK